ncbi:MAG: hypothetical protein ABL909_00215 [Sphingopyxis sp.]
MKQAIFIGVISLALASCGQRGELVRKPADPGPAIPTGDTVAPTAEQQNAPSAQARPQRSDEVLRRSEERQSDEYDLPPS